jgi:hypothetical protein
LGPVFSARLQVSRKAKNVKLLDNIHENGFTNDVRQTEFDAPYNLMVLFRQAIPRAVPIPTSSKKEK